MEVICINDKYPAETLDFWTVFGVSHPIIDKMYTIRESLRHFDGSIGVRVEEIVNPTVPIKHPVLGTIEYEPTFALNRFAKLNGDLLQKEDVEEFISQVVSTPRSNDFGYN
jgi:hypothetical protein